MSISVSLIRWPHHHQSWESLSSFLYSNMYYSRIQANQMAAIYALMEQNDGLQTSLEGIEDQLKMYGCTEN